ncbi:hypothetical protein SSS_05355 [Sarcoptes scabiei]|nr:hypothetical protein SSS_05355 [Sarcoptes scabiei]
MMESPKLSLTASFDDLCRFQNSISYNEKTLLNELKKILKAYDQLRSKFLSKINDLDVANGQILKLKNENTCLKSDLADLKIKYEDKCMAYDDIYKDLTELKAKVQSFNENTKHYNAENISEDSNLDKDLHDRLQHLRQLSVTDIMKNSNEKGTKPIDIPNTLNVDKDEDDFDLSPVLSDISKPSSNSNNDSNFFSQGSHETNSDQANNAVTNNTINEYQTPLLFYQTPPTKSKFELSAKSLYGSALKTIEPIMNHRWQNKVSNLCNERCSNCDEKIELFNLCFVCYQCGQKVHKDCVKFASLSCSKYHKKLPGSNFPRSLIDFVNFENNKPLIPDLLLKCCDEIERRGLRIPSIYLIKRPSEITQNLMLNLLYPTEVKEKVSHLEIHSLCNVIIHFLRYLVDLNDPLIPGDLCIDSPIQLNSVIDLNFKVVKDIVHKLPVAKRDTLAFLMIHLRKVLKNSNVNFVTKENLVEVFAPLVIDFATLTDKNQIKHEKIISSLTMKTLLSISSDFWIQLTSTQSISTLDSEIN